ncbi:PREDICTED: RNA-binding protein 7 [Lepidothrix coronata]|uniref:RNA-binding protein 7 n=1 Tax=Lepidothrix coronata TaxID=321398 RepID=A0A6J0GSD2_9PASS|nr:PREDICTED: RNA-binding protein 7 [Lepidothrix coronata]
MGAAAAEANRTLFVGNLDPKVTEELIFELFHQAGPVITVKIPKDRDGRPKQFAFVNFKHEESVPYGLQLLNGIKLYGRPMRIQFRSGSSHAAQDTSLSCSPLRAAGTIPPGMPHPASNCSRYERVTEGAAAAGFPPSLQRQAVMNSMARQQPQFGSKYEQPSFAPPAYPHAFHAPPLGSPLPRRPEGPALRKGRLGAHPYPPDSRHFGRERFGPDYGRGKRDDYGFDERGHDAEHHYRGGRDELYDDRHRDGWSHDYDHRRESYREAKWHPSRH